MRADEPRVTVRFSEEDYRVLSAVAAASRVKLSALVRDAALDAYAPTVGASKMVRQPAVRNPRPAVSLPPGVRTAREIALERQARINKGRP